jgi:hypothetical protein
VTPRSPTSARSRDEILAAARADDVTVPLLSRGVLCDHDDELTDHLVRESAVALLVGRPGMREVTSIKRVLVPLRSPRRRSHAAR